MMMKSGKFSQKYIKQLFLAMENPPYEKTGKLSFIQKTKFSITKVTYQIEINVVRETIILIKRN